MWSDQCECKCAAAKGTVGMTWQYFESAARVKAQALPLFGVQLPRETVEYPGGGTHSFDMVNYEAGIVGDAKKRAPTTATPTGTIASICECVLLLQSLPDGWATRFVVIGPCLEFALKFVDDYHFCLGNVLIFFFDGDDLWEQLWPIVE